MDFVRDTVQAGAQEVAVLRESHYRPEVRQLKTFLLDRTAQATPKNDPNTNVSDLSALSPGNYTYNFPPADLAQLYRLHENCRRKGVGLNFAERQGTDACPKSGLMLDFDAELGQYPEAKTAPLAAPPKAAQVPQVLGAAVMQRIAQIVHRALVADLALGGEPFVAHYFFIIRPRVDELGEGRFKYGFHLLVPDVRLSRDYKRHLIRNLRKDPGLDQTLARAGVRAALGEPAGAAGAPAPAAAPARPAASLDPNSAHVPVHFFGSSKRGKAPYVLGGAFRCTQDDIGVTLVPLEAEQLDGANLSYELALCARPPRPALGRAYDSAGAPPPTPITEPRSYEYKAHLAAAIEALGDRAAGGLLGPAGERLEEQVEELTRGDPDATQLRNLLQLLDPAYARDYDKWRGVVFALANASRENRRDPQAYYPLAQFFSQRCPEKWAAGGAEALERLWAEAAAPPGARRGAGWRPLTQRSIAYWARQSSPAAYEEATRTGYHQLLETYVYKHQGDLRRTMFAKVLHSIYQHRFVSDDPDARSGRPVWFEFVTAGQPMRPGEVWKWRQEARPDSLHMAMSDPDAPLQQSIDRILGEVKDKAREPEGPEQAEYFKAILKKLPASKLHLFDHCFKDRVIQEAGYFFRQRGFAEGLDGIPGLLGVANGVLRLSAPGRPRCELITGFHEWPVMRYTGAVYQPFDAAAYARTGGASDPQARDLLQGFAKVIPEVDMRVWFLMYLSTGLYLGPKDPCFPMLQGSGCNGKTSIILQAARAIGSSLATKLQITLLSSEREDASKPNSAAMRLKKRSFGYFEESKKRERLNESRLKEMVNPGEFTASEKNKAQEVFEVYATLVAMSNYGFDIDTSDEGTWRRLRYYQCKAKFCENPNPNNPYEHENDRRYIDEFVNDPEYQAAMLRILVFFWERLQAEYGGSVDRVPCPTLERETEIYRNSQDTLNRFITQRVVSSESIKETHHLSHIAALFVSWRSNHFDSDNGRRYVATDVLLDLENSALTKYMTTLSNGDRVIQHCRFLSDEDVKDPNYLKDGETHIGVKGRYGKGRDEIPPAGCTPEYTEDASGKRHYKKEPEEWWTWGMPMPSKKKAGGRGARAGARDGLPLQAEGGAGAAEGGGVSSDALLAEDRLLNDGLRRRRKENVARAEFSARADEQRANLLESILAGGSSGGDYSPATLEDLNL